MAYEVEEQGVEASIEIVFGLVAEREKRDYF